MELLLHGTRLLVVPNQGTRVDILGKIHEFEVLGTREINCFFMVEGQIKDQVLHMDACVQFIG